ncbi:hypothetical protein [Paenibacillus sp. NFR01]|uniref:hypothetical protein n=1 Tax=Paenibacillus sp. NFR01 TaxID=1566279 RepID=UPI0008BAF370|nr:hypothetical protein [Paenibacillus sp. NFR01]SET35314.1 hypothetical protein SAMN03159358_1428 [Paenibacillus sp. NFR01]
MLVSIGSVVVFLLFAAGLLAYQNSRLIAEREAAEQSGPTGKRAYTVFYESFADTGERPEATPLFEYSLQDAPENGSFKDGAPPETVALCRVPAGTGELALADAQRYMVHSIRKTAMSGRTLSYMTYKPKDTRRGEKELVARLEAAAKEEVRYADQNS